jgi:hypothetical protein
MTDQQRAALIAVISSFFPVLNLIGIVDLTSDEISILMLFITNALTTVMLFWRPKTA